MTGAKRQKGFTMRFFRNIETHIYSYRHVKWNENPIRCLKNDRAHRKKVNETNALAQSPIYFFFFGCCRCCCYCCFCLLLFMRVGHHVMNLVLQLLSIFFMFASLLHSFSLFLISLPLSRCLFVSICLFWVHSFHLCVTIQNGFGIWHVRCCIYNISIKCALLNVNVEKRSRSKHTRTQHVKRIISMKLLFGECKSSLYGITISQIHAKTERERDSTIEREDNRMNKVNEELPQLEV